MTDQQIAPWYKQPWLWFIIAPLIATVLYSTVYITASIVTNDGVVLEEYTKRARAFHEDNQLQEVAVQLGMSGTLRFDTVTSDINFALLSSKDEPLPEQLNLTIGHPTKASLDVTTTLRQLRPGHYVGELQTSLNGNRKLIISPDDKKWQLIEEVEPPYDQQSFTFGNQ
ncbi:FixH family protein [uncultured Amphritea sp.]|uniref:FixH family protein n=1 Tax=uncultured Amphritea sp. TaxID=981605 RepID=UPI002601BFF9|nr:FixH family protein [uncultured Amphritea sp.]